MNIRPARFSTDLDRIVEIINFVEQEPTTPDGVQQWIGRDTPGRHAVMRVAVRAEDEPCGFSVTIHEPWYPANHFYIWIAVHPEMRGQGIGTALYNDIETGLREYGAQSVESEVRDNDPLGLHFAEKRGFCINRHKFESTLNLETFDESPYTDVIPTLEASGIRLFPLSAQDTPDMRRQLYEVNYASSLDTPGSSGFFMSYEDFERLVFGSEWFRADGQWLAADGDRIVGLCAVRLMPETGGSYNLITGVLRPYRGRRIALGLKLCGIRYAKANGAHYMRTHNNDLNQPILSMNRKLGYQPVPGIYTLKK